MIMAEPMFECARIDTMKRGLAGLMAGILSHINSVPTPSKASAPDVPLDWEIIANLCEERISAAEGSLSSEDLRRAWHYCARGSSEQSAGGDLTPLQIGDRLQQAVAEEAVATTLEFLGARSGGEWDGSPKKKARTLRVSVVLPPDGELMPSPAAPTASTKQGSVGPAESPAKSNQTKSTALTPGQMVSLTPNSAAALGNSAASSRRNSDASADGDV